MFSLLGTYCTTVVVLYHFSDVKKDGPHTKHGIEKHTLIMKSTQVILLLLRFSLEKASILNLHSTSEAERTATVSFKTLFNRNPTDEEVVRSP